MLFRSNAAKRFDPVDNPTGHPVDNTGEPVDIRTALNRKPASGCGYQLDTYPGDSPDLSAGESLWLTGSESPIDRETLLDELTAERFSLPWKRKQR